MKYFLCDYKVNSNQYTMKFKIKGEVNGKDYFKELLLSNNEMNLSNIFKYSQEYLEIYENIMKLKNNTTAIVLSFGIEFSDTSELVIYYGKNNKIIFAKPYEMNKNKNSIGFKIYFKLIKMFSLNKSLINFNKFFIKKLLEVINEFQPMKIIEYKNTENVKIINNVLLGLLDYNNKTIHRNSASNNKILTRWIDQYIKIINKDSNEDYTIKFIIFFKDSDVLKLNYSYKENKFERIYDNFLNIKNFGKGLSVKYMEQYGNLFETQPENVFGFFIESLINSMR